VTAHVLLAWCLAPCLSLVPGTLAVVASSRTREACLYFAFAVVLLLAVYIFGLVATELLQNSLGTHLLFTWFHSAVCILYGGGSTCLWCLPCVYGDSSSVASDGTFQIAGCHQNIWPLQLTLVVILTVGDHPWPLPVRPQPALMMLCITHKCLLSSGSCGTL